MQLNGKVKNNQDNLRFYGNYRKIVYVIEAQKASGNHAIDNVKTHNISILIEFALIMSTLTTECNYYKFLQNVSNVTANWK